MKKINLTLIALCLLSLSFGFNGFNQNSSYNNIVIINEQPSIPDVMGYVNVVKTDGIKTYNTVYNVDSFPSFSGFPKVVSGSTFEGGILCNMDGDNDLELVYGIGSTVQAWNLDGAIVPGWPKSVSGGIQGAPSFGDIDGDGQGEIVVGTASGTSAGFIYAFEKDGSSVTGFPVNHGYTTRTIVLADVDNNGSLEIITNKRLSGAGEVYVYTGSGTVRAGWPKSINHVPASSSAVGDITGDNFPEIIAESYSSLYAWDKDGNPIAGFPFTMTNGDVNSYSSPVLADVDNDNIREIVFGTHSLSGPGFVYLLKNNGTVMSGWPKQTGQWIYGPPSVGYIDGDNIIDIAVGDQVLSGSPSDYVYGWNKNGAALTGFPIGPLWAINAQIIIGDIDNDNNMELICDDNTQVSGRGKYLAFNHDGTPYAGWDVGTNGTTFFSTPILGDVNRDGVLDIAGSGTTSGPSTTNVYLWNTGMTYNASRIIIPMWQYNSRHNGVYGDNPLVGINPVSSSIPKSFAVYQNYPNPFNPVTNIKFGIAENKPVKLSVYDILGKEISVLINEDLNAGEYKVEWNASAFPSGIYFYRLSAGMFTETKKMIFVK